MPPPLLIAPSILAADFSCLGEEVARSEHGDADWIHVDVMDGHFVPNLTIGPCVVESLRKNTRLPLDVHLMIENPGDSIDAYVDAGADGCTIHLEALVPEAARARRPRGWTFPDGAGLPREAAERAREIAGRLRSKKKLAGIALNPDTPARLALELLDSFDLVLAMTVWPGFGGQKFMPDVLPKVAELRAAAPEIHVEVDGGIDAGTIGAAAKSGANVFVAGTAVYRAVDVALAIAALREGARP